MERNGIVAHKIEKHLQAIHPEGSVSEVILQPGDIIYRWESTKNQELVNIARKNGLEIPKYFLPSKTISQSEAGLLPDASRKLVGYKVTKETTVLESTVNNSGKQGGQQYYHPNLFQNLEEIK